MAIHKEALVFLLWKRTWNPRRGFGWFEEEVWLGGHLVVEGRPIIYLVSQGGHSVVQRPLRRLIRCN